MPALATLLDGDPDDVVVYRDGSEATRGELIALAASIMAQLREYEGRAIGVRMPNTAEAVAAWFGAWLAGCAFVPLNPRAPEAEVARAT